MGRRYSDILKAAKDLPYLENYIKWMTSTENRQPNVGKRGAKKPSQKLGVIPFNLGLQGNQLAYESGALPTWEAHAAQIGNHAVALTAANVANVIKLERYSAARVIIVSGRSTEIIVKTSHITGRKYGTKGGHSTSLPFGKGGKDDPATEEAAFAVISAAIKGSSTTGIEITLKPEKFSAVSVA